MNRLLTDGVALCFSVGIAASPSLGMAAATDDLAPPSTRTVCVPPSVPAPETMVQEMWRRALSASQEGNPKTLYLIQLMFKDNAGTSYVFTWLPATDSRPALLVAVDDHTDDLTPPWMDMGVATDDGVRIRSAPSQSCVWQRVPPPPAKTQGRET